MRKLVKPTLCFTLLSLTLSLAFEVDFGRLLDLAAQRYGAEGRQRVSVWTEQINSGATLPTTLLLNKINRFFNRALRFADDRSLWHQEDYWAPPLEALGVGAGDCEGLKK